MRDLLYLVIGILLGLICFFFDGSAVMAESNGLTASSIDLGYARALPQAMLQRPAGPAARLSYVGWLSLFLFCSAPELWITRA